MKILIYGSKGWIGSQFIKLLHKQNIEYINGKSRVDNTIDLENEIKQYNPTHIISFIGRTHGKINNKVYSTIDYLEQEGKIKENVRDNLFSPISLALLCNHYNIHFTYLGTGCIFSYMDDENYKFTENDLPIFFGSGYSTVKGYSDRLMLQL